MGHETHYRVLKANSNYKHTHSEKRYENMEKFIVLLCNK